MGTGHSNLEVGYILRSYPRLSQTFILHEILALEQLGVNLRIFPITNPREPLVQPEVAQVRAPVHYLEKALHHNRAANVRDHLYTCLASPGPYFRTVRYVLARPEIDEGYTAGSRFQCFREAVYLVRQIRSREKCTGRKVGHLHAHFAHDPALIALLAHMLTGLPFSFTAHARDLFQVPPRPLIERVEKATAVVTCCAANLDYLRRTLPVEGSGRSELRDPPLLAKVRLIHHGVNLEGFQPAGDGARPEEPPLILSAGRLVEKKGFPDLLEACKLLKAAGHRFRCEIYGEGPMYSELTALAGRLGISDELILAGAVTQQELLPILRRADVFALTPFITGEGDRDGVPNVLVEAMACGVPVVSTAVSGVPELVADGCNGLLVGPHDVRAIAAALATMLTDVPKRKLLGQAARRTVVEHFDVRVAARGMAALFDRTWEAGHAL
jgi:glycosyltransferase involved in cell wall biosynthesis